MMIASYLFTERLVYGDIPVWAVECLLEKGEEHGDDDDTFNRLAKDDEKHRDGKHVGRHGGIDDIINLLDSSVPRRGHRMQW